jgi:hypothetical protein
VWSDGGSELVFDVREFVAACPSPVPAWPARRLENVGFRSLFVLVIPWSTEQWWGNGQHAIPNTPDAMWFTDCRPSDYLSDVPGFPTIGNRWQAQCFCDFQGNSKFLGDFGSFFPRTSKKRGRNPYIHPLFQILPKSFP